MLTAQEAREISLSSAPLSELLSKISLKVEAVAKSGGNSFTWPYSKEMSAVVGELNRCGYTADEKIVSYAWMQMVHYYIISW